MKRQKRMGPCAVDPYRFHASPTQLQPSTPSLWLPKAASTRGMKTVSFCFALWCDRKLTSFFLEICPVCKSSRYLDPKMRFLINPECYHKMCSGCVHRLFSGGPAPCPVAGCEKTLRENRFRKQTFEDINVEKEVDIRRRVTHMYITFTLSDPSHKLI